MDIPYTITARPDTGLTNGKLGIWLFLASEVMLFGALFTAYLFMRLGAEEGMWPNHVQNVGLGLTNTIVLIISSITMVWAWVALKERKFNHYRIALGITILCGVFFLFIKGVEYYSKFHHYGIFIKADAIEKYRPELDKMGAFVGSIPVLNLYEVRGHWENEDDKTATSFVLKPDAKPTYLNDPVKKEAASGSEEDTISIAKDDVDLSRCGFLLPAYGTYYAMYFTVTGLHALHIVGGLVVMIYFLTIGSRMYRRNPEQLSNRIEVTGIFWHFVDLVWITVFPILYLT